MPWIAIILFGVMAMQLGNMVIFAEIGRSLKALTEEVDRIEIRRVEKEREDNL